MLKILASFLILQLCLGLTLAADLDLNKLSGRWFLMYTDNVTVNSVFNNSVSCVIADASLIGEDLLNVTVWLENNGTDVAIETKALHDGEPFTSTLTVTFNEGSNSILYDVIEISDIDPQTDRYSFVILQSRATDTDDVRHLYVLYSNATSDHQDEIFEFLEDSDIGLPVAVSQGDECLYPQVTETAGTTDGPPDDTELQPLTDFELDKLLGRWYEVLTNDISQENNALFGASENGVCNIVTFCKIDTTTVSVYEQHWLESPLGEQVEQTGRVVKISNSSAVFNISMDSKPSETAWAVLLNSTSDGSLYSFIVFTDPTGQHLTVITRDVNTFQENNEVDVIGWLLDQGFTEEDTKPQILYQDSSCPHVAQPTNLQYPGSGCQPERSSSSSSFLVPLIVVALVAGVCLAVVASYYISKRQKQISYNHYGQF